MSLHTINVLAALSWDPQVRGFLIVVAAVFILPGTIYLLLSTNLGARMGFLVAIAGLSGWLMLLSITWILYAQGMKGRDPSWKVKEVVHSESVTDLSSAALPKLAGFPAHWHKAPASVLGDSTAAADNFITKTGRKPRPAASPRSVRRARSNGIPRPKSCVTGPSTRPATSTSCSAATSAAATTAGARRRRARTMRRRRSCSGR
jgi:hypothetical protein